MLRCFIVLILILLSGCGPTPEATSLPGATATPPARTTNTRQASANATPTASRTPTKTPSPSPTITRTARPTATLKPSASVRGIWGYGQLQPLSCESRSAADWARNFGIKIREMEFIARLPRSLNPEEGFVGSPQGAWGQIPPDAYGVHAAPVAKVLREYGAQAQAVRNLSFHDLRAEIAAGQPVIVWVTGHVAPGERSMYRYDGKEITVARYEHTVIVIGYDKKYVEILDGKTVYKRPIERFLESWSVLENMAILWKDGSGGE